MRDLPTMAGKRTTYENFIVDCPFCGNECVFNRASDLKTFEPIAGRDVACLDGACGKAFRIVSDSINAAYAMLIFDCYELRDRKHYMGCILSLAQAYEVFFALFFRVELLYKPFGTESNPKLTELNRVADELRYKIKRHAFASLRALFLQHVVARHAPQSIAESARIVTGLPGRPGDPSDSDIESLHDQKLVLLLKALKTTTIHELRNDVVHKWAYRPTRQEVAAAIEETRSILFPLAAYFNLHDEINRYSSTQ